MQTQITLNGKTFETGSRTIQQLISEIQSDSDVIIVNGFNKEASYALADGDNVVLIKRGEMPDESTLESMLMARNTPAVHHKVKQGRVCIAGLGGLGSNVAIMLARTGVGYLKLIDFDIVEPSNLNRQAYHIQHLGLSKSEALKQIIKGINPYTKVESIQTKLTVENALSMIADCEIVCEAFDSSTEKAMLINTLLNENPNVKIVSGSGMAGFSSANTIKTIQKFKNLYICGDMVTEATFENGLMAPRVHICAGHQANMILRLLLNLETV
ncbi:sulfur carrier protein ThiS adenylyltransferase ThiF [Fusibacter ferrireducens]|uniref:Sulfur carrier protein ThiS adenylyltransferase ThiF n=1 Tax=Fusibacter ferrireducens TaxID=2785058 RepID=A0ABR9ZPR8_9FIRM|nr:sulfur carrier protein ThiS adenylyltransferase ThiF [Fusibacter ferrireducens]MBF4692458.1 sulfur carrier protein ThiS adenylyltransferase ThiF [Fusibacter ferrireducens]